MQIARYTRIRNGNRHLEQSQRVRKAFTLSQLTTEASASNPRWFIMEFCDDRIQKMMKFQRLYDLLCAKHLHILVIPSHITLPSGKKSSLLHSKVNIFTLLGNSYVAFYTSAKDSVNLCTSNYEILCVAENQDKCRQP